MPEAVLECGVQRQATLAFAGAAVFAFGLVTEKMILRTHCLSHAKMGIDQTCAACSWHPTLFTQPALRASGFTSRLEE